MLLPHDPRVATTIPHALQRDGHMLVPHRREETRLLRNLGYKIDAPIRTAYDWPGPEPFHAQHETAALLSMNTRAYVLSTMGTGKTRSALFAADFLLQEGEINKVLILAPLSTLTPTWMNELFTLFHHRRAVLLHHKNRKKRFKLLEEEADFYVMNYDGVKVLGDALLDLDFDCVVVDELSTFKNDTSDLWKATSKLVRKAKFVWGMTGTPTPNEPVDAYGQIKLLHPSRVTSMKRFRESTMYQVTTFKWLPKPTAVDTVHGLMQPSVRFKLEDCTDIPPSTTVTRQIEMSPLQTKFYTKLKNAASAAYQHHEITAANEGVVRGKLMQVACGYVYTDEKKVLGLRPKKKLDELISLVHENDRKVIVFVPFRHALAAVAHHLSKHVTTEVIHGGVSKGTRDRVFYQFQSADDPHAIVAHPRAMSHGLTLTGANMVVWFCPPAGLETYLQANARIVRPGQTSKTTIVHLQCSAVEKMAYTRLAANESLQGMLLDMFEGVDDIQ